MSEKTIPCQVRDEHIIGDGVSVGAAGSANNVFLELAFSERWTGLTKEINWTNAHGSVQYTMPLTVDLLAPGETEVYRVPVPGTALRYAGNITATLRGFRAENINGVISTVQVAMASGMFKVLPSYYAGMEFEDPTVAERMQTEIDHIKETIAQAAQAADAKEAAQAAAQEAEQAKTAAEDSATEADAAKEEAITAKNAAEAAQAASEEKRKEAESWAIGGTNYIHPAHLYSDTVLETSITEAGVYVDTNQHMSFVIGNQYMVEADGEKYFAICRDMGSPGMSYLWRPRGLNVAGLNIRVSSETGNLRIKSDRANVTVKVYDGVPALTDEKDNARYYAIIAEEARNSAVENQLLAETAAVSAEAYAADIAEARDAARRYAEQAQTYAVTAFSVTLSVGGWDNYEIVARDSRFLADDDYIYIVSPVGESAQDFGACVIRPGEITEDGQMPFRCNAHPTRDVQMAILRQVIA